MQPAVTLKMFGRGWMLGTVFAVSARLLMKVCRFLVAGLAK